MADSSVDAAALIDAFPWSDYDETLARALLDAYSTIMQAQGARGAAAAGGTWDQDDPFLHRWATKYVGARVTQLQGTTREQVTELVRRVFDEQGGGGGALDLAERIRDAVRRQFAGYEDWRALRIARSECAIAYNHGDLFGFRLAGVAEVDVIDGTQDAICAQANGQRWTLAQALANPIGHPSCSRTWAPVIPDTPADEGHAIAAIADDLATLCAEMAAIIIDVDDPTPWLRDPEEDDVAG